MSIKCEIERIHPIINLAEDGFMEHLARYDFAKHFCIDKMVLDAGCGYGYGTKYISGYARKCLGIDISVDAINYANLYYASDDCNYKNTNCAELTSDEKFDVCLSMEFIEHLDEKSQHVFMRNVVNVLKNDGKFIVSTPNASKSIENEFHLHEFRREDFEKFLLKYFKSVKIFAQTISPYIEKHYLAHEYKKRGFFRKNKLINRLFGKVLNINGKLSEYHVPPNLTIKCDYTDYKFQNIYALDDAWYFVAVCSGKYDNE